MTKVADNTQKVTSVMIEGQAVPLEGEYTVNEARNMLMEMGIATNIGNAQAVMVTPDTVEFVNNRGDNGAN